jgi:hypothetical protein
MCAYPTFEFGNSCAHFRIFESNFFHFGNARLMNFNPMRRLCIDFLQFVLVFGVQMSAHTEHVLKYTMTHTHPVVRYTLKSKFIRVPYSKTTYSAIAHSFNHCHSTPIPIYFLPIHNFSSLLAGHPKAINSLAFDLNRHCTYLLIFGTNTTNGGRKFVFKVFAIRCRVDSRHRCYRFNFLK